MIEREFIKERAKHLKIKEYVESTVPKIAGIGKIKIERTPLGERIVIDAVKPGLIIGQGGRTISDLTSTLKRKFGLENPQIEVHEIPIPALHAAVVAKRIASDLERFGPARFKAIGYRSLMDIMNSGALGAEIKISGRGIPGQRAQSWRFPAGYMKKCGQVALEGVDISIVSANLRSGTVGVQVRIMPPDIMLPDKIKYKEPSKVTPLAPPSPQVKSETKSEEKAPEAQPKKTKRKKAEAEQKPVEAQSETKVSAKAEPSSANVRSEHAPSGETK